MAKTLDQIMGDLPAERRSRIEARADALILQEMALSDVRQAMAKSQQDLAAALGVNQAQVSKIEHRSDMLLSTLRKYIQAAGGTLELIATIPNKGRVKLTHLTDLDEDDPAPPVAMG